MSPGKITVLRIFKFKCLYFNCLYLNVYFLKKSNIFYTQPIYYKVSAGNDFTIECDSKSNKLPFLYIILQIVIIIFNDNNLNLIHITVNINLHSYIIFIFIYKILCNSDPKLKYSEGLRTLDKERHFCLPTSLTQYVYTPLTKMD